MHFTWVRLSNGKWSEVAQPCPTLCNPIDGSPPGSMGFSRHGYWSGVAISFSRGSSQRRDRTQVSCIADTGFTIWATRESWIKDSKECRAKKKKKDSCLFSLKIPDSSLLLTDCRLLINLPRNWLFQNQNIKQKQYCSKLKKDFKEIPC